MGGEGWKVWGMLATRGLKSNYILFWRVLLRLGERVGEPFVMTDSLISHSCQICRHAGERHQQWWKVLESKTKTPSDRIDGGRDEFGSRLRCFALCALVTRYVCMLLCRWRVGRSISSSSPSTPSTEAVYRARAQKWKFTRMVMIDEERSKIVHNTVCG